MKCRFCQNPLEEDCDFCSECGKEVGSTPKIVLCKGKKKNGTICGAELQKGKKFCKKCGSKVDQSVFEKEEVLCANCGHAFADDEDFCVDCGFARNGFSDTLPASTDEDSAALSSITKTAPAPPSGLVLGQNTSLDDNVYKTSQTTLHNNHVHAEYKSDSPDKEIDKITKEKTQTGHVQIENQPVVDEVDGTTSDGGTRICAKIDKMSSGDIYFEKKTESELEGKSNFVNKGSAVEVKVEGTLEDKDYQYTSDTLELDSTDINSATETAELAASSLLASPQSKKEAQVEKEKQVCRGGLEIEKEDINLKITSAKGEQFIEDVKDQKSKDDGSDTSFKDKSIVDQTAKGKDTSQKQLSEGSDNPEKFENTSKIETSGNLLENEVVESTGLTPRLREENPKTENVAIEKSTQSLTEKEDDDRHSVEELEENDIESKAIQEAKPTINQTSAVGEKIENIHKTDPISLIDVVKAEKIEDTHAADATSPIDEVKADNVDKIPVQVTKPTIGPTNSTEKVEAEKIENVNVQIENEELNKISLERNEVDELKENCTDKMLVYGTVYTRNPSSPITEEQEDENEKSNELSQEQHANGDGEPCESCTNKNHTQEKTNTADPGTPTKDSIKISNSPSGMETVDSSKFDKNQRDEKTKDSKKNQISDVAVIKAHGIKNEPERAKSLTSGKKQELGRKGGKMTRNGNQGNKMEYVQVYFHSLLSAEFDLKSADRIVVKFDEPTLGGWDCSEHKCRIVSCLKDNFLELLLQMNIPKECFYRKDKRIEYKYLVRRKRAKMDIWEDYATKYTENRTIALKDNMANIDEWHQYDGVVYFSKKEESFLKKNWQKISRMIWGDSSDRHIEDLNYSLLHFQPKLLHTLSSGQEPKVEEGIIEEGIMHLEQLLHCLRKIYLTDRGCFSSSEEYMRQVTNSLLMPLLESFAKTGVSDWQESAANARIRMLKAITVLSVVGSFNLDLTPNAQDLLARGLLVRPNHKDKKCHDLNCIGSFVPEHGKKKLIALLKVFLEKMPKSAKNAKDAFIFLCVPLYHFLTGKVKPFDPVPYDTHYDEQELKWWGIESLGETVMDYLKLTQSRWTEPIQKVITFLHPLFELDYFFPRTIMAFLNLEEVEEAVKADKIPLEVCAACLVRFMRNMRAEYPTTSVTYSQQGVINALYAFEAQCKALVLPDKSSESRSIQGRLLHELASHLLHEALLTNITDIFTCATQAFLFATAVYEKLQINVDGNMSGAMECSDYKRTLDLMNESVKIWLKKYFSSWKNDLNGFLVNWNNIVAPQTLPSETVRDAWNSKIEENLYDILEKESASIPFWFIDVYCKKVDGFQPCIQSCLSQIAFKVIEEAYDPEKYNFGPGARGHFGKLLSEMFLRDWRTALMKSKMENDRFIMHYAFNWMPFPHFLNMLYGDDSKHDLSDECCFAIAQARSLIVEMELSMEAGSITIIDFNEIIAAQDKYLELATISCKRPKHDIDRIIQIRQREVDSYNLEKNYVQELIYLCQHLEHVNLEELNSTIKELEDNKMKLCINDICEPANVEAVTLENVCPRITAFKLSDEVISMLRPLHEWIGNNTFITVWVEVGSASNAESLDDVCEQVWKPAYNKMKDIIQRLENGDLIFDEMEKYLGKIFNCDPDKMLNEMISLKLSEETAKERIKQLQQFHELESCVRGAKAILNLVDNYRLNGDFKEIKIIASQESAAERKMKEFDESVLQVCTSLRDLAPEKINCLENFNECKPLVDWLRESMPGGLKELKVFVDLAMISAGEGDMEIDKVNCLHTATTGYASLIFDLDVQCGYKELLDRFETLWNALKVDPKLPAKLHDANRHLGQLKTVKQAHGSVEVTSLAQAEAISSLGVYKIGAFNIDKDTNSVLNLQNVLHLTLPGHGQKKKGQRNYTFEQLQDLQSRLMLVAGKSEQGNEYVDRFMLILDNVIRLANVFLKLTSAGCVLFKHWQTRFLCDPSRPVCAFIKFGQEAKAIKGRRPEEVRPIHGRESKRKNDAEIIRRLAQFMETCLKKWEEHISQKRMEYFELNYFTSDQLVILQQELVKFGMSKGPDNRIYPLLSAVKENCTYEDLVDAMRMASKDMKEDLETDGELKDVVDLENKDVRHNETERREETLVQKFIKEIVEAGYSEKLARASLQYVTPDNITDGVIWCSEHTEDESMLGEENVDTEIGDSAIEGSLYEGWKKSDKTVSSLTAEIINKMKISHDDKDVEPLMKDLEDLWEAFLSSLSSSVSDYLSVEHLGLILRKLTEKEEIQIERPFPPSFVVGVPNLIVCPKAEVLSTVLSVYMMDLKQPLPQADEVLMCTPQTTLDQLDVFFIRTVTDKSSKIHCLVNSDLLGFEVSDVGERRLEQYMQENQNWGVQYRLVVICSLENEYKSHIIAALDKFRRPPFPIIEIQHIADYVRRNFEVMEDNTAAVVDFDCSSVRVVKSHRAGVGKSLYVMRRSEELAEENSHHEIMDISTIRLQDKEINVSHVMQILLNHIEPPGSTKPRIFHLDIAHEVQEGVDFFLFNLLILGCLTDKSGYVWRRSPQDLYLVETVPIFEKKHDGNASYVHHVFDFLPYITCRSPQESLDILTENMKPEDYKEEDQLFDAKEFNGPIFQRPYQYLSQLNRQNIDNVDPSTPFGSCDDCLKVLLRYCGIPDPSWAELHHFVWFLNTQLLDFEKSVFCSADVAEDLPGFSKFVLKFLVQMSRDFSIRSLKMTEESPTIDQEEVGEKKRDSNEEGIEVLDQFQMKRTWESSPHPYLFFNPDGQTITFLGFYIERRTGDLIDQQTGQVLEPSIMKQDLFWSLIHNRVPIQEDFDSLERREKIERLCRVMGNDSPHDPDDTYELTTDNVKKILAIYMRFRCDIPVIIMGETGCGKTRLVKFMCALQTPPGADVKNMILMKKVDMVKFQCSLQIPPGADVKNMILTNGEDSFKNFTRKIDFVPSSVPVKKRRFMPCLATKVHGGTTKAEIKKKVEMAKEIAQQNAHNCGANMYTVLFFDEANTTEAIGMIKEIMCDKSLEGKVLDKCQNLRFVAACNPYRKHSEDLIKRLEKAGLGYHVDADKTTDRLGRVPMRRLVYRVQPLPQSLLPLVWDFGQLETRTENLYIRQMVRRYIQEEKLPDIPGYIEVVSRILTASQYFMRKQQDECSFVSLRDVERVLSVMSWFYAQSQKGRTLLNRMDQMRQETFNQENTEEEEEEVTDDEENDIEDEEENDSEVEVNEEGEDMIDDQWNKEENDEEVKVNEEVGNVYLHWEEEKYQEVEVEEGVVEQDDEVEVQEVIEKDEAKRDIDDITRSLVLSLGVCYHACLKKRSKYRKYIARYFKSPCHLVNGADQIHQEIIRCQNVFLENIQLEKNIARNTALKENVFMMVICTELRIPLFLVGKPGSSKSLAKTIVADAMQGNAAHADLFKEFKQVQMVSFQCSPLSTPAGIVGTFRQCAEFQKDKDLDRFVSMVVLDEVGLAEDSPRMPLKTLHPLLEDGCQGDEEPEPYKKVAFIGISNWALDPAKMNRGILVQREMPRLVELVNTAKGICSSKDHVYNQVKPYIKSLAESYLDVFEEASSKFREFFGLRDFYSLMKMIYSFVEQTNKPPTWNQLRHSIKRNFGGLDTIDPIDAFAKKLTVNKNEEYMADPSCITAEIIKSCLDCSTTQNSVESRYLLLLTMENYGALAILQQLMPAGNQIITIFGSSFPNDQEYTQVCRNINRIKVCMETGNTVVLLNLENLYESLYDALNQYYVYFGGERYVDLGLGTHRVKCRVHKNFRLIVVAEKDVVYKKFPIPLINRLEKHFLTANTILSEEHHHLAEELEEWAKNFSEEKRPYFVHGKNKATWSVEEVFMGFHADTCSSIILHLSQRLEKQTPDSSDSSTLISDEAKKLLLWCATPDAVIRLEKSCLPEKQQELFSEIYMREQCHENLAQYLHFKLKIEKTKELFAQITTHSKLLSAAVKSEIEEAVGIPSDNIALETLQSFDTEQQFCRQIRSFLESKPGEELLFLVQCDSGDTNANLVACARYCIMDEHQKTREEHKASCHVILIIQLPRIAGGCFTGFQCGQWHSVHIDDLRTQDEDMPLISEMLGKSVGTLMEDAVNKESRALWSTVSMELDASETDRNALEAQRAIQSQARRMALQSEEAHMDSFSQGVNSKLNVRSLILSCVQPALALVRDKEETTERSTRRIELMLHLLHSKPNEGLSTFLNGLSCQIAVLLKEKEKKADQAEKWLSNEAAKPANINKAGTFRRACTQYLETKISPVLAGIIAHIDTNQNLDILYDHFSAGDWKAKLWLQILNNPGAIQLAYSDLLSPGRQQELNEVFVKSTGCEGQMFSAEMPFSWLIFEQIESIWRTAQERQQEEQNEDSVQAHLKKITDLVKETQLGQLLDTCEGHISTEEIVHLYVKDFTIMVYHTDTDVEKELVCSALLHASAKLKDASSGIVVRLVWIHECHHRLIQHLLHFRSINQVWPECSKTIKSMQMEQPDHFLITSDQFTLTILGLSLLIEQLNPPDKTYLNDASNCQEWLRKISIYRPVIEKGLTLCSSSNMTGIDGAVLHAQQMWTRVTVVKLFIEHVVTYSDREAERYGVKQIMPLWVMLGESPDFKQMHSLEVAEKFLKMCTKAVNRALFGQMQICSSCRVNLEVAPVILPCEDVICRKCFAELEAEDVKICPECSNIIPENFDPDAPETKRKEVQKFKDYLSRCNSFFMDVVSQLCFAYNTAPSDQVVDKLLGYITMTTSPEREGKRETCLLTKELSIFEDCVDPNPVFRSFLLQLLLKTSEEKVHSNLEKYFMQAKDVMSTKNTDSELHMVQLSQLVVQCLEDLFYQNCANGDEIDTACRYLKDAEQDINPSVNDAENEEETNPSMLDRIYGIAKARFGLAITAKHIHETIVKKKEMVTPQQRHLIQQAANLCMGDCKWPKTFFIKYLCRCFGVDTYQAVCRKNTNMEDLSWIKYEKAEEEEVKVVSDRYIVCESHYINIREAVAQVVLGVGIEQLDRTIRGTKIPENRLEILLCLAMHREITMSSLYGNDKRKVNFSHIKMLMKYCSEASFLKNKDIAQKILQNTCGIQFLTVTPDLDLKQQGVLCLLMHCDITLKNLHGNRTLVQPLVRLATQPRSMSSAYIPTMPLNDLADILDLLKAQKDGTNTANFYICPNGHPYVIGECGRPWVESKCPECGSDIGGTLHNAHQGNVPYSGSTETGHTLGRADNRIQIGPKRKLNSVGCAIVRLLTHLAMMLGTNLDSQAVSEFIKPDISDHMDIPQFLWQHIVSDLDDLHRTLGKSLDDVFIIMHIILSYMMEKHDENEQLEDKICSLTTKEAREEWESVFYEKYVAPKLQDMEFMLEEHNKQMVQNATLGTVRLLNLLYETEVLEVSDPLKMLQEIPAMWRYRSRITIDHMQHEFEITSTKKSVKQPKVLKLFLKEEHHLRAIHYIPSILKLLRILFQKYQRKLDRAEASTMITVGMLRKQSKNGDELPKLLDEYAEAWDLVRESLTSVPIEYRGERINDSTPISWLLPTASDAGQCADKLLKFLFHTQNYFLDSYYREVKRSSKEMPRVKVRDITPAHLISYHPEQDILPLVLANCNYSFEVGKGTTIEYNFANLERQIVDRFLFGKSWINIEIELMVYRAEYTNSTVFKKLQEKISQEPLSSGVKHQISEEFHSLPDLCQALDNLDIAISFLKSIGGNPGNSLDRFLVETLKMKQSLLSTKARQICQYRHAQSLWLLLSLEKNKKLALHNQMTFDGVNEKFKQQLSDEHQKQVMTYLQSLSLERLGLLLELMFECIVLVISVPQDPNDEDFVDPTEKRFSDYLQPLMDEKHEKDVEILDTFPEEVLCKFCVATWTLTCESLHERKGQN